MNQQKTSPQHLIEKFKLQPHVEGGWYSETYRSAETIDQSALPERFGGHRSFSAAIYFLLEKGNFSSFHRIKGDECWHFYAGDRLDLYVIHPDGRFEEIHIGNQIEKGEHFQYVVPGGCWFASRPASDSEFCFVGCTTAPGFDFDDFELAKANELVSAYPQHESLIRSLCRQ